MTTLGVAIIAGTLTLASLFMRSQEALILEQEALEQLTLVAQEVMSQRQRYLDLATQGLPWFVLGGCLLGLILGVIGLSGWLKRQRKADELEDIAVEKGKAELRKLSDAERIEKAERDALDDLGSETVADAIPAYSSQPKQSALGGVMPMDIQLRTRAAMNANIQTEASVALKLEQALGESYVVDIGVVLTGAQKRRYIDVLARPIDTNATWYLFEIKRLTSLSFVKNYEGRIADAITTAVMSASAVPHDKVTPVAIVAFDDADPDYLPMAREYGAALAASFTTGPVFLLLSSSDLEQMSPASLAAQIGASAS